MNKQAKTPPVELSTVVVADVELLRDFSFMKFSHSYVFLGLIANVSLVAHAWFTCYRNQSEDL